MISGCIYVLYLTGSTEGYAGTTLLTIKKRQRRKEKYHRLMRLFSGQAKKL